MTGRIPARVVRQAETGAAFEAAACLDLWAAVIFEQVEIVLRPQSVLDRGAVQDQARAWFRTKDFATVCALAGFDPDFVRSGVNRQLIEKGRKGL